MSTPDMSDVTRLVNANDPAPDLVQRIQGIQITPKGRALVAFMRALPEDSEGWLTGDDAPDMGLIAAAIQAAITEAQRGYALVRLPEPDHGDGAAAYWETDTDTICASITAHGRPFVDVVGENFCFADMGEGRAYFTAGLAACDHAVRLADEHNTATQDAEEASRG